MILCDVNVLVYAYREDAPGHAKYRKWLENVISGDQAYGMSDLVLSRFLRIVTHPKIFSPPSPLSHAMQFVEQIRSPQNCVMVAPGLRHWEIFKKLLAQSGAKGNLVPDAYFAALAIESGSQWITTDHDYSRFPGLNWRSPFD